MVDISKIMSKMKLWKYGPRTGAVKTLLRSNLFFISIILSVTIYIYIYIYIYILHLYIHTHIHIHTYIYIYIYDRTFIGKTLTGNIWDDQMNIAEICSQVPGNPAKKKNHTAETVPKIQAVEHCLQYKWRFLMVKRSMHGFA